MEIGRYSPAPFLASLLPNQEDMNTVMKFNNEGLNKAIRRFIAEITSSPNDAELWYDLSRAFGQLHMIEWRFVFVAHLIDPKNIKYLQQLAITYNFLGDCDQAISLMNKALAIADKDVDRIGLIHLKMRMETNFDDRLEVAFH